MNSLETYRSDFLGVLFEVQARNDELWRVVNGMERPVAARTRQHFTLQRLHSQRRIEKRKTKLNKLNSQNTTTKKISVTVKRNYDEFHWVLHTAQKRSFSSSLPDFFPPSSGRLRTMSRQREQVAKSVTELPNEIDKLILIEPLRSRHTFEGKLA